jgi:hypothetical protein
MKNVLFILLLATARMEAATVTNTADSGPGSLRNAITTASNGEIIDFAPGLQGDILLTTGELVIDQNVTINGPGADRMTIKRGIATGFRIVNIRPGKTVTIKSLTIFGGYADSGSGAGIYNDNATLSLVNCVVEWNNAGVAGGGIFSVGTLTISDCLISNNQAAFSSGNPLGDGGGILSSGTLTITSSTISDNFAAIYGGGIIASEGTAVITNSTISNNRAGQGNLGYAYAGGIDNGGTLTMTDCTTSGNRATGQETSGSGAVHNSGTLRIFNSTLSGNFGDEGIYNEAASVLILGNTILKTGNGRNITNAQGTVTITSLGYNLSSDDAGGFLTAIGDQINTDPMLGPLQDNGGPTFTHGLLTNSPAIDRGDPSFTPPPLSDQRGYARVFNGRTDIGSLEVQPAPTPTPTPTPTSTATATPTATATATATAIATATPSATASPIGTPAPTATPTPSPTTAQLANISTRLRVGTGDRVMIAGFIITGNTPETVVARGMGPSLTPLGVSGALADPTLEVRDSSGALLFSNDDWQDNLTQAKQVMGWALAPGNPKESAMVATLQPGAYTAILSGKNGSMGVGLVEVYGVNQSPASSELANISTRGFVETGDDVMIGGFILGGNNQNTGIAVRGLGPSLSQFGLNSLLADPVLELRDGNGMLLIANDNWQEDPISAAQLSARGLAPQDAKESGIFASLPPGAFTAILAGKNGGTGIGLVEVYCIR